MEVYCIEGRAEVHKEYPDVRIWMLLSETGLCEVQLRRCPLWICLFGKQTGDSSGQLGWCH